MEIVISVTGFKFCTILSPKCEKPENTANIIFYTTREYKFSMFFCVIGVFHRLATADSFQGRPIFLPIHLQMGLFILQFWSLISLNRYDFVIFFMT